MGRVTRSGDYNAICEVCGDKLKASQLRERWDKLMVCSADWETRHPADFYKTRNDTHVLPWTSPDSRDAFTYLELLDYTDGEDANTTTPTSDVSVWPLINATPTADWVTNTTMSTWTIMAWVKPAAPVKHRFMSIFSTRGLVSAQSFSVDVGGASAAIHSNAQLTYAPGGVAMYRTINDLIIPDRWQHVCWKMGGVSGTATSIHINGEQVTTIDGTLNTFVGNSDPLWIGNAINGANRPFHGGLRDIRIFNTGKSANKIRDFMGDNFGMDSDEAGLIGWWKMDEGSGNILADSQTNYEAMDFTIDKNGANVEWKNI